MAKHEYCGACGGDGCDECMGGFVPIKAEPGKTMTFCSANHAEIAYSCKQCPVCEAMKDIDNMRHALYMVYLRVTEPSAKAGYRNVKPDRRSLQTT